MNTLQRVDGCSNRAQYLRLPIWILGLGLGMALALSPVLAAQAPPAGDPEAKKRDEKTPEQRMKEFREKITAEFKERLQADDKNSDGKLSKEELGKREGILRYDKNADGLIDLEEYVAGRVDRKTPEPGGERPAPEKRTQRTPAEQAQELLKKNDKDGDGKLTKEEAPNVFAERTAGAGSADKNGDGSVNLDELTKWIEDRRSPGGAQFAVLDKNGDGKITKEEAPELDGQYPGADADKDGSVSREEFAAAMRAKKMKERESAGGAGGERDSQEQFKRMDKNGDGKITKEEAPQILERMAGADADKDGAITSDEFAKAMRQGGENRERPRGQGMGRTETPPFAKLDKDGDGKLTGEERGGLMAVPGIDADKDGSISAAEYAAFFEKGKSTPGEKGTPMPPPAGKKKEGETQ